VQRNSCIFHYVSLHSWNKCIYIYIGASCCFIFEWEERKNCSCSCKCWYVFKYWFVYICVCKYACIWCVNIYVYVYIYAYIYMFLYLYMCRYIHTYIPYIYIGSSPVKSPDVDSVSTGSTLQSVGSSWASSWATLSTSIEKVTLLSGMMMFTKEKTFSIILISQIYSFMHTNI
jgi:hypothetical protein